MEVIHSVIWGSLIHMDAPRAFRVLFVQDAVSKYKVANTIEPVSSKNSGRLCSSYQAKLLHIHQHNSLCHYLSIGFHQHSQNIPKRHGPRLDPTAEVGLVFIAKISGHS